MTDMTARLGLPYLVSGQAQKDVTHNEALALIDACLVPSAEETDVDVPPTSPAAGQCWVVGTVPSGAWTGRARALAIWTDGGWRFVDPIEGMRVWIKQNALWATYIEGAWTLGVERAASIVIGEHPVVGARQPAVPVPAAGATIDGEARMAISAIIARLEAHGLVATNV